MTKRQPDRFHGDPSIRHRYSEKRRQSYSSVPPGASSAALFRELASRVACPHCSAPPEQPCVSGSKRTPGESLTGHHHQRVAASKEAFGRKPK